MPLPQKLFRDLRAEAEGRVKGEAEGRANGEAEGEVRAARLGVLDVYAARFGEAPSAVAAAVDTAGDLPRLREWLRAVSRATDPQQAERAILGPR